MNFKSEKDIQILRPLKRYLDAPMHPSLKKAVIRRLKIINRSSSGLDSEPFDVYRIIGAMTIKIQIIEEVNKMLTSNVYNYMLIVPWSRELYMLWMNCHKQLESATQAAQALVFHERYDGIMPDESSSLDSWKFVEV